MLSRPLGVLRRLGRLLPPPKPGCDGNGPAAFDQGLTASDSTSALLSLAPWTLAGANGQPAAIHYFTSPTR